MQPEHDVDIIVTDRKHKNSGDMIEDTQWHPDIFLRLTRGSQGGCKAACERGKGRQVHRQIAVVFRLIGPY